jgi:hypothetical protein
MFKLHSIFGKKTLESMDKQQNSESNIGSVIDNPLATSCHLTIRTAKTSVLCVSEKVIPTAGGNAVARVRCPMRSLDSQLS